MKKIFEFSAGMIFFLAISACTSTETGQNLESQMQAEGELPSGGNSTAQITNPQIHAEEPEPAEIIDLDEGRTSMRILWQLSGYVLGENFVGEESDAKAMIFEPLDISDDQIIFLDKMCSGVVFTEETVDAAEYISLNWEVSPQALDIVDMEECSIVRTNCALFGFQEYLRLKEGRLIVPFQGTYYLFEPNVIR